MKNDNINNSAIRDELLAKINGGTDISEFSDIFIEMWTRDYGQPDGSFRYVCPNCGAVITGTDLGTFYDDVLAHFSTHMPNMDDITNGWDTSYDTQRKIHY